MHGEFAKSRTYMAKFPAAKIARMRWRMAAVITATVFVFVLALFVSLINGIDAKLAIDSALAAAIAICLLKYLLIALIPARTLQAQKIFAGTFAAAILFDIYAVSSQYVGIDSGSYIWSQAGLALFELLIWTPLILIYVFGQTILQIRAKKL